MQANEDAEDMDTNFVSDDGLRPEPLLRNGKDQDQNSAVEDGTKILAYRNIVTERGFIAQGEVGYVSKAWINKIIQERCACKGNLSWFKFL